MKTFSRAKIKLAEALVIVYLTVLMIHHVDRNASTLSIIIINPVLVRFAITRILILIYFCLCSILKYVFRRSVHLAVHAIIMIVTFQKNTQFWF